MFRSAYVYVYVYVRVQVVDSRCEETNDEKEGELSTIWDHTNEGRIINRLTVKCLKSKATMPEGGGRVGVRVGDEAGLAQGGHLSPAPSRPP